MANSASLYKLVFNNLISMAMYASIFTTIDFFSLLQDVLSNKVTVSRILVH